MDHHHSDNDGTHLSPGSDDGSSGCNDPGKMFIGGLSWQTTAEGLRDYFSKFGEVNECMVMRDPATKRARGFGFITFADPASVDKVLAHEHHELDGKKIDPKVAFPKRTQPKMIIKTKKVFIGGLSATSTLDDMKSYFEQYGKVEDAMLMFDKATQRHRGFGFITFDNDDVSDKVCEIHFHEINGKMVECKKAQPKEVMLPVQLNKSRAAAARNLYGIGPEQLLAAYTSFYPRLGAYGANLLYPGVLNGFQSYAPLTPASPPGNAAGSGLANGVVPRGFSTAAAQAAQQVAALEALYGVGAEPFAGIYPPLHHQAAPVHQHTFHKV